MEGVLAKGKEYEVLVTEHDPVFKDLVIATEIVKKFIIDNKLIIYGGTAIDMALKLHGDRIYPDDLLPDLDFYSPQNVEHSYQLADILYEHGYKEARAINALHMETMKVDIVDNHWIADITYRPREIFDKLPVIIYNGMMIIHPNFQRIDLHSSLAFPYDNVPREVIFDRWSKDIKRFNLLNKYYPIGTPKDALGSRATTAPMMFRKYVAGGFFAYALLYHAYITSMNELEAPSDPNIISGGLKIESNITFDTIDQKVEIMHFDLDKIRGDLKLDTYKQFETYMHAIPERVEGIVDNTNVTVYSTQNRLISADSIKINNDTFRTVNIQYLLKHFLSMSFMHSSPKLSAAYLLRYTSMLAMISSYETALVKKHGSTCESLCEIAIKSPFFPTIKTYGNENINLARTIALNRLYHDLEGEPLYVIPRNYYPDRSNGKPHPDFDPTSIEFFQELGREIK